MGIQRSFSSYADKHIANGRTRILTENTGDRKLVLVVDAGSAAYNLSFGMAQQLLDMDVSLLFIADGSVQPEQDKGGEWKKRLEISVDKQLKRLLNPSRRLDEDDQDVGLCYKSSIKRLQRMYSTQNKGKVHYVMAYGEADFECVIIGSLGVLTLENMKGKFPTWQESEAEQQMRLLEGRHVCGVLAVDSDYILTEGLTYLKMDTLESFQATDSQGHMCYQFYCVKYQAPATAQKLQVPQYAFPYIACLLGTDATTPWESQLCVLLQTLLKKEAGSQEIKPDDSFNHRMIAAVLLFIRNCINEPEVAFLREKSRQAAGRLGGECVLSWLKSVVTELLRHKEGSAILSQLAVREALAGINWDCDSNAVQKGSLPPTVEQASLKKSHIPTH